MKDVALVVVTITEVLKQIQADSGYEEIQIDESTCPLMDLQGFDSKIWPVSIGMIGDVLGIEIPLDENIYISKNGIQRLTIRETASVVHQIVLLQENKT